LRDFRIVLDKTKSLLMKSKLDICVKVERMIQQLNKKVSVTEKEFNEAKKIEAIKERFRLEEEEKAKEQEELK
jgi:hypothetical protein